MSTAALIPLSWHPAAHHLIAAARAGADSLLLVGPPGTGKTAIVLSHADPATHALRIPNASADDPTTDGGPSEACSEWSSERSIEYVLLGSAPEPATLFAAVLAAMRQPLSPRLRRKGASVVLQHVANWLAKRNVGALALDEVEHASSAALFHALLLADVCRREHGHALGLILIGTPDARDVVSETGQIGQRVPVELTVPLLNSDEVITALRAASPDIARLLRDLRKRDSEALLRDVVGTVQGSIRRLHDIVRRSVRFAKHEGVRLTADHVRAACDAQAD